ncbi:MAG: branched-chain amino acid transaminase [Nitrosopumilus sp.]|nr:branched-chain amino acid transaminase [Nitrosopumilus sp.]
MLESKKIWIDGKFVEYNEAKIHVLTHGLHYGTGVFEGIRSYVTDNGPAIFRLDDHIKRLFHSGKSYFMHFEYNKDEIRKSIIDTVNANNLDECYIRIIAFYGYGRLGVNPLPNKVSIVIAVLNWSEHIKKENREEGINTMVSSWMKVDVRSMPSHAKGVANYANSALARMEALKSGVDEAIMMNSNGFVVEASAENIFLVKDGVIYTPPISTGALEGITRDTVIEISKQNKIPLKDDNISRDELYYFDEAFLTGTASEIVPIGKIDHRVVGDGKIGPITKKIQNEYGQIVRGKNKDNVSWLTYIK